MPTVNSRLPSALEAAVTAAFGQGAEDDNEDDPVSATQRVGSRTTPATGGGAAAVTVTATAAATAPAVATLATAGGGGGGGGGADMSGVSRCVSPLSDVSCIQKQLHGFIPTNEAGQPVKSDKSNRNINSMFPAFSSSGIESKVLSNTKPSSSTTQSYLLPQQQQQQQHGSLPQQQRIGSYTVPFNDSNQIEKNIVRSKSASKPVTEKSLSLPLPCSPSDIYIHKKEERVIHRNQNKDSDNVKYSGDQNDVCEEKKAEQVEVEVEVEGVVEGKGDDDENENVNNVNEDLTAMTRAKTPIATPSSLGQSVLDTMYSMMRSNFS